MLDDAHDESGRDSGKERGEYNPPDHVSSPLVAGKADGVARIVSRVMGCRDMRKPDAENQENADHQSGDSGGAPLVCELDWKSGCVRSHESPSVHSVR
jgi:hypothetical protein